MPDLIVFNLGEKGVNVDKDPLVMDPAELRKAQNIIPEPLGAEIGVTNRPGLLEFNASVANGRILGGISVPLQNLHEGTRFMWLGRGPTT